MIPSIYSKYLVKVFWLVLFLSVVSGVSAQSLQNFFIPKDILSPDWVTLLKREHPIESIASINLLDVEYLKAWGFEKAIQQAFQTPKGLAYVIIEQYGDSTGPPKRLEHIKHRNEIEPDPRGTEKHFSGCGQEGIQTKYVLDAKNSIHKIFFYQGPFFFLIDSFDEKITETIGQWICGILSKATPSPTDTSPRLTISAPSKISILPYKQNEFEYRILNKGSGLEKLTIEVRSSNPDKLQVSRGAKLPDIRLKQGEDWGGKASLRLDQEEETRFKVYIFVIDSQGETIKYQAVDVELLPVKIIAEKPVQILIKSEKSYRNMQTFLQAEVSPESLWLLPGETKPFNIKLENVGEAMAAIIQITAVSADKNWIDIVGEQDIRFDPSSGSRTTTYRSLSDEWSFNLDVGETREKSIYIKAGTVSTDYIHILIKGKNFPSLEESILIQVSPKGTPRTPDEEMSRLFDPARSDQILFRKMAKDEMYRWEGGNLYYGDCMYIPGYGPSCDLDITPKSVVYVIPDLSKKNARFEDLWRLYNGIFTESRQAKTNIVKATTGIIENKSKILQAAGFFSKIRQVETESGFSGLSRMAGFLFGPLADAYNLIENLRERNLNFLALEGFFPGAEFGYIHHRRKLKGKWDSVYSKAFFVKDTNTDIYYVYVIHELLQ